MGAEPIYLSATGVERLGACEQKWSLQHLEKLANPDAGEDEAKSDPLRLGTLWHTLTAAWRAGNDWRVAWQEALDEVDGWDPEFEPPDVYKRAHDLMSRYVRVYGEKPPWTMIANELPFDLPVPGVPGVSVHGFMDGLVERGTRRKPEPWLWEDKSMGRWGPDARAPWNTQNGVYLWAAKTLFDVQGIIFDAVSTYPYKDPEPVEKAFRRIEIPYDERYVSRVLEDLQRAARRAKALVRNPSLAIRSVGEHCTWCSYQKACLRPWELEA
jgi:hypothetical protein